MWSDRRITSQSELYRSYVSASQNNHTDDDIGEVRRGGGNNDSVGGHAAPAQVNQNAH